MRRFEDLKCIINRIAGKTIPALFKKGLIKDSDSAAHVFIQLVKQAAAEWLYPDKVWVYFEPIATIDGKIFGGQWIVQIIKYLEEDVMDCWSQKLRKEVFEIVHSNNPNNRPNEEDYRNKKYRFWTLPYEESQKLLEYLCYFVAIDTDDVAEGHALRGWYGDGVLLREDCPVPEWIELVKKLKELDEERERQQALRRKRELAIIKERIAKRYNLLPIEEREYSLIYKFPFTGEEIKIECFDIRQTSRWNEVIKEFYHSFKYEQRMIEITNKIKRGELPLWRDYYLETIKIQRGNKTLTKYIVRVNKEDIPHIIGKGGYRIKELASSIGVRFIKVVEK